MSAARKKPVLPRKPVGQVNKKALYWLIGSFAAIIVIVSAMLIFSN